MAALFDRFATELVEEVVTYLDIHDVASLRLTCRDIGKKASYGSFTHYFRNKNIDLDWQSLCTFIELTSKGGGLATHLQRCTIGGIPRNEDSSDEDFMACLDLLTKAFLNIKNHSPKKALVALSLRVSTRSHAYWGATSGEVDPRDQWRQVWKAATQTYRLVTTALSLSSLAVLQELNLFSSIAGCSLESSAFTSSTQTPGFATSFGAIKTFKLSMSAPLAARVEHSLEAEHMAQMQTRYSMQALQAVQRALHHLPLLENLEVHWYQIERIQESVSGFSLEDSALLTFITATKAPHIRLHGVKLVPPPPHSPAPAESTCKFFASVFALLLETCTSFHLEDVFEDWRHLRFPQTRQPSSMPWFMRQWGSTVFSCGSSAKQKLRKIEYGDYTMYQATGPEYLQWEREHKRVFGPPGRGYALDLVNAVPSGGVAKRFDYPKADYMQEYLGYEGVLPVVGPTGELMVWP